MLTFPGALSVVIETKRSVGELVLPTGLVGPLDFYETSEGPIGGDAQDTRWSVAVVADRQTNNPHGGLKGEIKRLSKMLSSR